MHHTKTRTPSLDDLAEIANRRQTPETTTVNGFDYLVDPYYDGNGWQLRGARRTAAGRWESALIPLGQPLSVGGADYDPASHRALIWDVSAAQSAGPCPDEPLMGAMAEATHLVLLELDPVQGALAPAGTIPTPAATFFFLGYRQQSNSVVLHSPADPINTAIYEVTLPELMLP